MPVMENEGCAAQALRRCGFIPIVLESGSVEDLVGTIARMAPSFGGINLEDISAPVASRSRTTQERLDIPVFHDDQHGTAIVVLAGLINRCRVLRRSCPSSGVVVASARAAGVAVAKLLQRASVRDIVVCDSRHPGCCRRASTSPITSVRSLRRRIREGCTVALVGHSRGRRLCRCFGWAGPRRRHCPNVRWRHDLRAGESPRRCTPTLAHRYAAITSPPGVRTSRIRSTTCWRSRASSGGALDSGADRSRRQ